MKLFFESNQDFPTPYNTLAALEKEFQSLAVTTKATPINKLIPTPEKIPYAQFLALIGTLSNNKIVRIHYPNTQKATRKVIPVGYPLDLPLDIILPAPRVTDAKRSRSTKLATRQIIVIMKGNSPDVFDPGKFEFYKTRECNGEPLKAPFN